MLVIVALLGGIGLFLLGMGLLTDGLQTAAGERLRQALRDWTKTPLSGLATGAILTALVQSSSATTLVAVGFVGAGLLSFSRAIGVVYGANVGTTATSWIVALVGLNVKMEFFAFPFVGIGSVGKIFMRGRRRAIASAIAGFGLLFVGIDVLQTGMSDLGSRIDPARFASGGIGGGVLLFGLGVVMTVVMQSSSAAVATTLAAVEGGALGLEQAAAVVIGQNVGTTVTALIGAAGGTVPAKRVAAAHVVFNVGTAIVALLLLPIMIGPIARATSEGGATVAIAAFHTVFNVLGVAIFLPLTGRLVPLLERLVPERSTELTRRLISPKRIGRDVAVQAAQQTAVDIANVLFQGAIQALGVRTPSKEPEKGEAAHEALRKTRAYLASVRTDPGTPGTYRQHLSVLHAIEHLHRLVETLDESKNRTHATKKGIHEHLREDLTTALESACEWLGSLDGPAPDLEATSKAIAEVRKATRPWLLDRTARGELEPDAAERELEATRWIDRLGYHAWRATHHLERANRDLPPAELPAPESEGKRSDESHAMLA